MLRLKAPSSFRRYRVSAAPRLAQEELLERLARRRFLPLDSSVEEDERFGWITLAHLMDTRFELESCIRDPYVVFALRIDKRRVPANILKAHIQMEEQAQRQATGKPLSPKARRELREEVRARLLTQVLPAAASAPVIWSPRRRCVYFGSASQRPNEVFKPLFEDTFDLDLEAMDPGGAAAALAGGDAGALRSLALLTPSAFCRHPIYASARGAEAPSDREAALAEVA